MILTFRRLIVVMGCLLYAGACVALAKNGTSQGETVWVLWAVAIAHLIFGAESILQCFLDDPQQDLDQLRKELEAERRDRVKLEEIVSQLSTDIATLLETRGVPGNSRSVPNELID